MASQEMEHVDDIKAIPGYKVILKAVLRTQIQQLVEQLAAETNEESVILTANVIDGTFGHLGSDYGKMFLSTYADVKQQFLGFCLHGHQNSEGMSSIKELQTKQTSSSDSKPSENRVRKTSRNSRKRKKYSKYVPKSRYTPYQNKHQHANSPTCLNEETSDITLKELKDCQNVISSQNNSEPENSNNSAGDLNTETSNLGGNIKAGTERVLRSKSSNTVEQPLSAGNNERCDIIQKPKDVADDSGFAQIPSTVEESSERNVDQEYNRLTDNDIQASNESVESVDENRQEVSGVSLNHEEEDADSDTTVEWSENPDLPDESVCQDRFSGQLQHEVDDNENGPPDIVSDSPNPFNRAQESLKSKHVIVTKHTAYDSADDEDEDHVNERSRKSRKVSQTNVNESSADDSNVEDEDDQYSKGDSIKDYLSDEESKLETINAKLDNDDEKKSERNNGCDKAIKDEIENKAKTIEVMQVCHETMDQMTHCIARAISEERKEKIATLEMHTEGLSEIRSEEQSRSSESDGNIEHVSIDEPDNATTNNEDTNDSVQTNEDVENTADTGDADLQDKSFKVLAIWNEIANDTNEASSEVLYDLIADKLKQDRQKKKSVEKDSQTETLTSNVPNMCTEEQTKTAVERNDHVISKGTGIEETDGRESENSKRGECHEERIRTEQGMTETESESNNENSLLRSARQSSSESDSNKCSRQNSLTRTSENADKNSNQQGSCDKQVMAISYQTMTESRSEAVVGNETKVSNESEIKTKITEKKDNAPVVINIDANRIQTTKAGALNTPVKQVVSKVTSANAPKQVKNPTPITKQKVQSSTPGKQGKSLVDNLISTGVPIIIPDDDDDDEEMEETDDFMPSPRSTAFEIKSKQYREQQEMRAAKRISQVAQRQGYGTYIPQSHTQMPQNNLSSKQPYSQYPAQLQQQQQQQQQQYQYQEYQDRQQYRNQQQLHQQRYQYQEYHDQQQFGNQQVATQQMYSSQQTSSQLRQQLFTPPKNVTGASSTRGRSVRSLSSPVREMSPQSHNFSPPQTPTTPKGSPYFKQGYITPTKHQQNIPSPQTRTYQNQSPVQKTSSQQNRLSSVAKPNIPSGTTIIIEDEPVAVKRKLQTSTVAPQHLQQYMQKQTYVLKSPVAKQQQQQQQLSVQRPTAQQIPSSYMDLLRQQQQAATQLQAGQGLDNRPLNTGSGTLPVISNVASVSLPGRDNTAAAQMQQQQYGQYGARQTSDVDASFIRQANEKTPIKRTRSDDAVTSPTMIAAEPSSKRRHTSAENTLKSSHQADVQPVQMASDSVQGQSNVEGQVSPSKIPPKLEIDIDDVRGVLSEPSYQLTSLKSQPNPSDVSEFSNMKEEKPVIPISSQLARSDLKSFSPPVSPSTKRLHAAPGTRSKTTAGNTPQTSSDESSVTSQEAPQTMKKFGCGDCGKSYTTKAALNQHFRKHTQERPFECDVCGKHYSQKGYLKKHIRTHFEEK